MKPITISWTALQYHEECKQKGYLKRSRKKNPMANIRGFFHGTVADRVMRAWLEDEDRKPGQMVDMVVATIEREEQKAKDTGDGVVRWKSLNDKEEMTEFVTELVRRLEFHLYDEVLPHQFHPEFRFRFPIEMEDLRGQSFQVILVGGIDILVRDAEGNWRVWDLKGTTDSGYYRKVRGQLALYNMAVQMAFPPHIYPTTTGILQPMVEDAQVRRFSFSDEDYNTLWSRMQRMVHDILRQDHTPKDGVAGCDYCDVRHACVKFKRVSFSPVGVVGTYE